MRIHTRADDAIVSYTRWVIRYRWPVLIFTLALTGVASYGFRYFALENDYRVFFSHDDPKLVAYEATQNMYTKDESLFFVVTAKSGNLFDRKVLEGLNFLTEESWKLPHTLRADSLTNFQHARAEGDDLFVEPLIGDLASMSDADLEKAREIALGEPLLVNRLIKAGSAVTGVNLTVHIPEETGNPGAVLTKAAKELAAETMRRYPEVEIGLTGLIPLNNAFRESTLHDLKTLIPVMIVVLLVMMAVMLQSFWLMLAVAVVVLMSTAASVGIVCWMGYRISNPVTPAPLIILTLAVADCVHIIMTMQFQMRHGLKRRAAIIESMRINMNPVFVTSLTTAIGFLSMNFKSAPPVQLMGNVVSLGVLIAWVLAALFLPALLSALPFHVRPNNMDARVQAAMARLAEWVIRRRRPILWALTGLTLVFAAFVPKIHINNQFAEWFEKGYPIRRDTEYLMENLTGIYMLTYSIGAGESGGVNDPEYLQNLDKYAAWLRAQDGVVHVSSVADTIKRLNKSMHGDDPAMYRLPETRDMAAQYLLLYEMSLPMGIDLNTEINVDKSATRMVVTTANLPSEKMAVLIRRSEQWQRENLPARMYSDAIGPTVLFCDISRTMFESMMISAPFSLILVILCLMVSLRTFRLGLLAAFPNLMPLAIGLGFWGMTQWDMNFSMTSIVAMTIGIIVDNTIHFLSKYLRARREHGLCGADSVRYAFSTCGVALWTNAVVLVAGFAVMTLSVMVFCDNMGVLSTIMIISALVSNLGLLPALLMWADPDKRRNYRSLKELQHEEQVLAVKADA
ncbi:MAG: MMPL family transporter [Candidatus Hydrogenedentes bacterium]|nr:MMPL family transporter [Candidatus Hydrogenedentota bacterium]